MVIECNIESDERRDLALALGEILGTTPVYRRAPTFAYAVGGCQIGRDGNIVIPGYLTHDDIWQVVLQLRKKGYCVDLPEEFGTPGEDAAEEYGASPVDSNGTNETDDNNASTGESLGNVGPTLNAFTVELPLEHFTQTETERIRQIVASKEPLLKRALGTDDLSVQVLEDKLCFPWFRLRGLDGEADAYARLVAAIGEMAKRLTRVESRAYDGTNDKFAMRLFLVRLGFTGSKYKNLRKILTMNLTGNSAWRDGHAPD